METTIVAKIANAEYGIEAVVAKIAKGFSVALRDADADEYVGIARIYPTEDAAMAYAAKIVA